MRKINGEEVCARSRGPENLSARFCETALGIKTIPPLIPNSREGYKAHEQLAIYLRIGLFSTVI